MSEPPADRTALPSPALLEHGAAALAEPVIAEVRSDASIKFDPRAAPAFLTLPNQGFGALVTWRVVLAWSVAQTLQTWLTAPSPLDSTITQEEELRQLFNGLEAPPAPGAAPESFLSYLGLFISADLSAANYTLVLGMRFAVPRQDYQAIWMAALAALKANPATKPWYDSLVVFLRLMLDPATTEEDFSLLASNVGNLAANPGNPMVALLLNP